MPIVKRTLSADTINDFSKRSINTMFYEEGNLLILQWCSNYPWMTFL